MTILQEILNWSKGLPSWESDAIARLLAKQTLSPGDLKDLYALLKTAHGIPDAEGRTARPLADDHIPALREEAVHVELLAIKNMRNVNAIAESKRLPIGNTGLTVIYGDNGSGKSGYSRVLKRACRARDQGEPIHPNANQSIDQDGMAKAVFEIAVNGVEEDVHWINGKTPPPELSSLAIFDSRCARAYLDDEDDFSYIPYGLDVLEGLASVCIQLKSMIEIERSQYKVDPLAFKSLHGDTKVGELIANLSPETTTAQIEALATMTTEELAQHIELGNSLKENNPKEKANHLRLQARRISNIAHNAADKAALIDKGVVETLRGLADSYQIAKAAADLSANQFREDASMLPGTGGEAWRALFEAARRFALQAHPDKSFPKLGVEALCPLCQQPLAEGADRLLRFEAFIQNDAQKNAHACRTALDAKYDPFAAHVLALNLDDVTYGEIEALDPQLAIDTRAFEQAIAARHSAIKTAVESNQWGDAETDLINPALRLQTLVASLNAQADTLEAASDEQARAALQRQFDELDARVKLNQIKESVITAVSRLSHQAKLTNCLAAVKTNAISLKSAELAEKVVSQELAAALNREFKALGAGDLSVSLQSRSERGRALHKLRLEFPQRRSPGDILSEGEQRAVAIGSFLAEVGLGGSRGGIIFDDPVSSLDHLRRGLVAKRLAAESAHRQVIVFTHDIYFLCLLMEQSKIASAPITTQSLVRCAEGCGIPDPELPFEAKNVTGRIGALKAQQQFIAKLHRGHEEQEHRRQTVDAYSRLRMTWERAVEEILLRDVIQRFRKSVETNRLAGVIVEDSDYAAVNAGMTKCSNFAHDTALMGGVAVPEPDELLADIMALEAWRSQLEARSKEALKRRKK
ncbi:MAG: AAA family ATPase [Desulfarculus sp.]|nr:AAA family ATPase [Desulfarculus sp.]